MMLVTIGEPEKRSSGCRKTLPLSKFRRRMGRPGNRQARCKSCARAAEKATAASAIPSHLYRQRTQAQREVAEEVRKLFKQRAKAAAV